jgi:AraC-like DNA-binding protein
MMRTFTGRELHPLRVSFRHPEPESTADYARIFRCPVLFGQKENSMTLDLKILVTPVLIANPALRQRFEEYAQDLLSKMGTCDETVRAVTRIILSRLDEKTLSMQTVATQMAISVRTLQKRLAEEGVLYSGLLEDIRIRLARQYLRENYTVEQITYLLGFSDPSVFRKAFKKWTGATPKEYREVIHPTRKRN